MAAGARTPAVGATMRSQRSTGGDFQANAWEGGDFMARRNASKGEKDEKKNKKKKKEGEREPIPFCNYAPEWAEHARFYRQDEPCDDSRMGGRPCAETDEGCPVTENEPKEDVEKL